MQQYVLPSSVVFLPDICFSVRWCGHLPNQPCLASLVRKRASTDVVHSTKQAYITRPAWVARVARYLTLVFACPLAVLSGNSASTHACLPVCSLEATDGHEFSIHMQMLTLRFLIALSTRLYPPHRAILRSLVKCESARIRFRQVLTRIIDQSRSEWSCSGHSRDILAANHQPSGNGHS